MKVRLFFLSGAYFVCTCLFFASCSSSSSNASHPKSDTVVIDQMKFIPAEIKINKGDTVVFINNDIVAHDATEINKKWNSPTLSSGDSWHCIPEESADYYCSIHLVMKGKIIVE